MDPKKAFATPEERKTNVREGIAFMDELMGPDKTLEMAEKIAKASEIGPEAESKAKAAAAFEAMAAFGEPVPFATALGRAGAAAGRNIKEYEKLKREADREANKLRLDTARYERAEKRGKISEARQIADKMEDRNVALYNLETQKTQALANIQLTREQQAQAFKIAEMQMATTLKAAGISANRPDINIEALRGEVAGRVADHMKANNGKAPDDMQMAKIRQEAVREVLPMLRPSYGSVDTGRINSMQSRIKEINDQMQLDDKNRALPGVGTPMPAERRAALEKELSNLTTQINQMRGLGGGFEPPPAAGGGFVVTAPNGKKYSFPNKEQADAFKAQIGG
jgi:hypothetical protein